MRYTRQAQEYLLSGKITNSKLEPLPYASIRIKELNRYNSRQ